MTLRARKLLGSLIAAIAVACAFPAAGMAAYSTFGSDLSASATHVENHGADTAFWNPAGYSGSLVAPEGGEVQLFRLKGGMHKNTHPDAAPYERIASLFHWQVLRPQPDGSLQVLLSSGRMYLPVTSDPNIVTSYGMGANPYGSDPLLNICVEKGDVVAFNTVGGHEYRRRPLNPAYQGAEIHVFGERQGAQTRWYEKGDGTYIGDVFPANEIRTVRDRETLVQARLATGPDSTDICPGGYKQHVFRGLEIAPSEQDVILRTSTKQTKVRVFCHYENYGGCHGTLRMTAWLNGVKVELGRTPFAVPKGWTVTLPVQVSDEHFLAIRRARSVEAKVIADGHDDPANDARVKWGSRIPVQHKTTSGGATVTTDTLCDIPEVKGRTLYYAKRKLAKRGCPLGTIRRVIDPRRRGIVIKQTPGWGKPLSVTTSKVALTVGR